MTSYLDEVDEWERRLAAGQEVPFDCLGVLQKWIRVETIQPIFDRLGETSKRAFLARARSHLLNFDELVNAAPTHGDNPETYFVIRDWTYRQAFAWKPVPFKELSKHHERGGGSSMRLFEEVVPHLREHTMTEVARELRPGWRNGLREFGRGLRPGLDVVCDVARAQGVVDPMAIRALVQWAESTRLERTHYHPGE